MPKNWKTYKLGDVAKLRKMNISPQNFNDEKYIGLEHIGQGNFLLESIGHATDVTSNKSIFHSEDILYGKIRPYFKKAYRPNFSGICSTDILVIISKSENHVRQDYLYELIKTQSFTDKATETSTGTKMPRADWNSLKHWQIVLPPIAEQKDIAQILSAIDDKIENNLAINKTLEDMAMALYKHWFVDFGPFQDGVFVESELGMIPEGWEVINLDQIAYNYKKTIKPMQLNSKSKYLGLEHFNKGSLSIRSNGLGTDVSSNKFEFEKNDILFGKLRPYFKKVAVAPFMGICSTDILVVRPILPENFGILLGIFIQDEFIDYCSQSSTGTRMPRTNWNSIANYKICKPKNIEVIRVFNDIISDFSKSIVQNVTENENLTQLRDTLLPKLISGDVRLKEFREQLETLI